MTVYFIGAGPGAADLITVRGLDLIRRCHLCLYAGSLVPRSMLQEAPLSSRVIDTSPLTLDEIISLMEEAHARGDDIARVHSGDPCLYGAIGEQMRRLAHLGIPYDIVPGVTSFAAAAALLKCELTLPDIAQTVILTRTAMKASQMPPGETLSSLAAIGATLVIHLSIRNMRYVCETLKPYYGDSCPVAVVYRASWPDEQVIHGVIADIREKVRAAKITRTALILVGPVLGAADFPDSALYSPHHTHILRNNGRKSERLQKESSLPEE